MAAITGQVEQFDIGRVIEQTFGVITRNFVPFFALALALAGLPRLLTGLVQLQFMSEVTAAHPAISPSLAPLGWMGIGGLVSIFTSILLQATVVAGTVADLNGRPASVGESLGRGLRFLLPLLAIGILMTIALFFGFLLLIVPGFILMTIWAVVVPAEVTERAGVFGAFERSAELTRGRRWSVFALIVIYMVLTWIVGAMAGSISMVLAGGITGFRPGLGFGLPGVIVGALARSLDAVISASGVSVLYFQLRASREGVTPTQIAAVFD